MANARLQGCQVVPKPMSVTNLLFIMYVYCACAVVKSLTVEIATEVSEIYIVNERVFQNHILPNTFVEKAKVGSWCCFA